MNNYLDSLIAECEFSSMIVSIRCAFRISDYSGSVSFTISLGGVRGVRKRNDLDFSGEKNGG
jgi:hypothetical protein